MKLCVFQGTFNPIHNAHLRVAKYIKNLIMPDKFLFIPAYIPPHKDCSNIPAIHRLNMVKLAVSDMPEFEVSDIEYKRTGKSYTRDTIVELYKIYDITDKIYFIIGTDAFSNIESWYKTDELKQLVKFIVFIREKDFNPKKYEYLRATGYDFDIQILPFEDISSTTIREGLKMQDNMVESNIPKKVTEYIKENGLYKN